MASMKPATGILAPATAWNMGGPDTSLGQPPPLSANSSQVARDGAKVLVSCWNPPIPMRIGVILPRAVRSLEETRIGDRKSTRLNSSHVKISYAVFCLKKKNKIPQQEIEHTN